MESNHQPLAVAWSPLRPAGVFVVSVLGVPIWVGNQGADGLVPALLIVGIATVLSMKAVSKLEVHHAGLVLRLGPFGLIRTYVPKDVALLQSHRSPLTAWLRIDRRDGPILASFLTVRMFDRWPEDALREAGYRFVNKWFREEDR